MPLRLKPGRGLGPLEPPSAAADQRGAKDFPPWPNGFLFSLFLFRWPLPAPVFGLVAFAGYWGIPCVMAAAKGVLITTGQLDRLHTASGSQALTFVRLLMGSLGGDNELSYAVDRTHLLFSVLLGFGAAVGALILRRIGLVIAALHREGLPNEDGHRLATSYAMFRAFGNHWLGRVVSLALGIATLLVFLQFYRLDRYSYWWGSSAHGYTGLVFACIECAMVYYATQAMFLIGAASLLLGGAFAAGLQLRPFHPDGCNGLSSVGLLIFLLWILALVVAGGIFIVLYLGYLGLQKTQVAWALVILATGIIPFTAIIPLHAVVRAVSNARDRELKRLEPLLHDAYSRIVDAVERGQDATALSERMASAKEIYALLRGINIWPFNPQALTLLMSAYAAQALLTLHEFIGQWPTNFLLS